MKRNTFNASALLLAAATALLLQACLKDTGSQQYKIYTPVYKASSLVRTDIVKNTVSQPIINPGKIYVIGNNIFLVEKEKGIHIIDNTNPSSPVNKAFISIPGNEDIAVKGNILFADCFADLFALDISDPSSVKLKNYITNLFPDRRYINGQYIDSGNVIVEWKVKDTIARIQIQQGQGIWTNGSYMTTTTYNQGGIFSSTLASQSSSAAAGVAGSLSRIAIVNARLYAVSSDLLSTVNITDPSTPALLTNNNIHMGIGAAETIYPFQDKLFIGSMSGMYIFSITNPDNPALLSTFTHAKVCDPVITDGTNAYITLHTGTSCNGVENELDVVNVQDPTNPVLLKKYNLVHPFGLSKDGNTLFVCDDALKVYDATDPHNLQLKQTITVSQPYDIICLNRIAIVSAKDGLYQFDYSNPFNLKQISKLSLNY